MNIKKYFTLEEIQPLIISSFPILLILGNAASDIGLSLVAVLFAVYAISNKKTAAYNETWIKASFAFWGFGMLHSLIFAEDVKMAVLTITPWIRYPLAAAACFYWLKARPSLIKTILILSAVAIIFSIIDGLFQYYNTMSLTGNAPYGAHLTGTSTRGRLGVRVMFLATPLVAYLLPKILSSKEKILHRLTYVIFIIGTFLILYLSGSRGALLAFIVACGLIVLLSRNIKIIGLSAVVFAITFTLSMFVAGGGKFSEKGDPVALNHLYFKQSINIYGSNFWKSDYGKVWGEALQASKKNLLTGVGIRHYHKKCRFADDPPKCWATHSHNFYLEALVSLGIFGLGIFLWMIGSLFWPFFKNWRLWLSSPVVVGIFSILLINLLPFKPSSRFMANWIALPIWWLFGIGLGLLSNKTYLKNTQDFKS